MPGEVGDELLGDAPGAERHGVDPVDGRLEVERDGELDGWAPCRHRAVVVAAGLPVCPGPHRPEPGEHVAGGQRGERAQGEQAEPPQQVDQAGRARRVERLDGQRREELR